MQISSKFTIALHIFACTYLFGKEDKITSEYLACSINVHPVVIRSILQKLKKSELVKVARGVGGTEIAKELEKITLLDIYNSVEVVESDLFSFHKNPNIECPLGRNIHNILDDKLIRAQNAMEKELEKITLREVMNDADRYINSEAKI